MKNVMVLGAGMVGSAIARDLAGEQKVTVADIDPKRLDVLSRGGLSTRRVDISDSEQLRGAVADQDLVIGAVPGFLGFSTLKTVVEAGKSAVDISFFEEDPFELDENARENGVTAVVDCGVAPGMGNIILGFHDRTMRVDFFECLVGGLPVKRSWPFQYKAPFSPIDVLEEYIRPARMMENGEIVAKPALSEPEYVELEPVGTLEACNTDGLRTLLRTMKTPTMREKTLRYPGHIEYVRVLLDSGFFSKDPVDVGGVAVSPIDLTAKLLFRKWRLGRDEPDITLMRIRISGEEGGAPKEYTYDLFDQYDEETGTLSMARTTGYTCSSVARLLLRGEFRRKGVCPPEYVGAEEGCFHQVMGDLRDRGVIYRVAEGPPPA